MVRSDAHRDRDLRRQGRVRSDHPPSLKRARPRPGLAGAEPAASRRRCLALLRRLHGSPHRVAAGDVRRVRARGAGRVSRPSSRSVTPPSRHQSTTPAEGSGATTPSPRRRTPPTTRSRTVGLRVCSATTAPSTTASIIKTAAGQLDIGGRRVGYGYVWAASDGTWFPPTASRCRRSSSGRTASTQRAHHRTHPLQDGGFSATCTAPSVPTTGRSPASTYRLVQLTSGSRKGQWISASFAKEYP